MKQDIISLANKKVGDIDLDEAIFGIDVRGDLMARTVNWQLAKRRAGTHKTKGRSEVNGTKAKPFRQKGTGRARQGSIRSPLKVGGGVSFGPKPKDWANKKMNRKEAELAIGIAIQNKASRVTVVDSIAGKIY